MKILAIDSSAISAGCAIVENGNVIAESFVRVGLTHSETLLPEIRRRQLSEMGTELPAEPVPRRSRQPARPIRSFAPSSAQR